MQLASLRFQHTGMSQDADRLSLVEPFQPPVNQGRPVSHPFQHVWGRLQTLAVDLYERLLQPSGRVEEGALRCLKQLVRILGATIVLVGVHRIDSGFPGESDLSA